MPLLERRLRTDTAARRKYLVPAVLNIGCIVVWATLGGSIATASAQSITAPAHQSITHSGTDAPQAFSEAVWDLISGLDTGGYTAQWSCSPFVHSVNPNLNVDSMLAIRVVASEGSANWTAIVSTDHTDYAAADETAVVAAQSFSVGSGQVGLTVTFFNNDFSILGAGNYTMTVTGTITAN